MSSRALKIASMKFNSKRNRQLVRESIHLPFYERISRNASTENSSVDLNEEIQHTNALGEHDRITLSPTVIRKCKEAFGKADINSDGFIDMNELGNTLFAMGYSPSDRELTEIMNDIDQNGDHKLDWIEFLRVVQRQKDKYGGFLTVTEQKEINIREAWNALSNNTTGRMEVGKFRNTLKVFDLRIDINSLITSLDADHSGYVDFAEFHELFAETIDSIVSN
eukprot:537340_1